MCTKGFLNYLSVIVVFFNVVFNDEIVKFSKNCSTVKPEKKKLLEIFKNCKRIIIIINCIMVQGSLENSLDLGWRNGLRL